MPLKLFALIPPLAGLAACATPEHPRIVDTSCTAFQVISYAQLPAGVRDDPGNKADSEETVKAVDAHNAKWDALCSRR